MHDIYPDLVNHKHHEHISSHTSASSSSSSSASATSSIASSLNPIYSHTYSHIHASRPPLHHYAGSSSSSSNSNNNNQPPFQVTPSIYTTNRPVHPYKPTIYRPTIGDATTINTWETNHLGLGGSTTNNNGITNHLDNFFDVQPPPPQAPSGHAANPHAHEQLPHAQAFAVGNVLDLNAGEAAEDYNGAGSYVGSSSGDGFSSYRPVPGTTTMFTFFFNFY